MPHVFLCSQCTAKMSVPDGNEGKRVKCPKCNALQTIPNPHQEVVAATLVFDDCHTEDTGVFTESGNPWQPPHEENYPLPSSNRWKLTHAMIFSRSFAAFTKNTGSFVVIMFVYILIFGVLLAATFVMDWVQWPQAGSPYCYHILVGILAFIQLGGFILELGALAYSLCLVKTGEAKLIKFVAGLRKFIPCLAYGLIYGIMLTVPSILIHLGAVYATMLILGVQEINLEMAQLFLLMRLGLAIVPLFLWNSWISVRFGWGLMAIIDENVTVLRAFQISWQISRNNTFVLILSLLFHAVLLSIILICTFGLGILVTIPYMYCVISVVYCSLMVNAPQHDKLQSQK